MLETKRNMHVKCLEYIVYGPTGWGWQSHKVWNPEWDEIENAIRRLNCFEYPSAWLWTTEDEADQSIDGTGQLLEVMGGNGVYWLAGSFEGYFQRRLDYPEQGDGEVDIWTSDQGFADSKRHTCADIESVLHAARYYYEHGGFDPSLRWEEPGEASG